MKIGIDARCLEWQRGGVSRFLVKYLELNNTFLPSQKYILYFQNKIPNDSFLKKNNFECKIIIGPKFLKKHRIICEQFLLPFHLYFDRVELLIAPWYTAPILLFKTKLILGLWDISFITHPSHYKLKNKISLGFFAKISARQASSIITCSEFDSLQLQKYLNYSSSKILTLNFPAENKFLLKLNESIITHDLIKLKINSPYILSLGVIYNRRNIPTLIDAFEKVIENNDNLILVIVGSNATNPKFKLNERIERLVKIGKIIYFNYIDEKYLVSLYKGALLYYCTSDVDGEAILLKEAMLSGTPILSSTMLRLATNNYGTYVNNPKDKNEVANAINFIIDNPRVIKSQVENGLQWVSQISWDEAILKTTNLINKIKI